MQLLIGIATLITLKFLESRVFNAKTINNLLFKDDCQYLIDVAIKSNLWENGGSDFWKDRVINYNKILNFDKKAAQIMLDANLKCKQSIQKEYNLNYEVYSDTLQIVRWFPEMEQPPHADDMSNTIIEGFDHRAFGSIIYLNDNYEGGKTYYPNFNFEINPEIGKLAIHPGDFEHLHGVTKIKNNIRYTIASFWTKEKSKSYDWSLY
jgi:hypothetical protein